MMIIASGGNISNISNQSFEGYKKLESYGTLNDHEALQYKIKLNPKKIDSIMRKSTSSDKGLVEVYKMFVKEDEAVTKAFSGMNVILKHYIACAMDRNKEILKERPHGSKIPFVGIAFDLIAKGTGGFVERIQKCTKDLIDDYNKIVSVCYNKRLNKIVNDYNKMAKHFLEGMEYMTAVNAKSPTQEKIQRITKIRVKNIENKYDNLSKNLTILNTTLTKVADEVILKQKNGQNKRILVKGLVKIITAGVS